MMMPHPAVSHAPGELAVVVDLGVPPALLLQSQHSLHVVAVVMRGAMCRRTPPRRLQAGKSAPAAVWLLVQ